MTARSRVLVVDHEPGLAGDLEQVLSGEGYLVRTALQSDTAISDFGEWRPHLVFTDHNVPGMDGIEFCRRLRAVSKVPLIVLSKVDAPIAKAEALDSGADDYVVRPFVREELLARTRAVLRRTADAADETTLEVGVFRIDFDSRRVHVRNAEVRLTPKEFDLLVYLARHPNRVVEHGRLLEAVWGPAAQNHPEYLRVFVGQLRKKVEDDPSAPRYLTTEAWVGYRLNPNG